MNSTMKQNVAWRVWLPGLLVMGVAFSAGCDQPPATQSQDVIDYIRNARAGAVVRRLDPEPQAYVDRVMKAYGAYQKACKPVADLTKDKALWPQDSATWRDEKKIKKLRDKLVKWQEDKADPDDPKAKARPKLLAAISEEIAKLPSLPDATSSSKQKMIDDITGYLGVTVPEAGYADLAAGYIKLLSMIVDHADELKADKPGLVFADAELTSQATSTWQGIHDVVKSWTDMDFAKATDILAQENMLKQTALEQKQALRSDITTDSEKMRQYRRLELLFEYYDTRIKWAEKFKKQHEAAAAAEKSHTD